MRLAEIYTDHHRAGLEPRIAAYFAALGPGVLVSHAELIDLCWGRSESGGPDKPEGSLDTYIQRIRSRLRPGWAIANEYRRGFYLKAVEQRREAA